MIFEYKQEILEIAVVALIFVLLLTLAEVLKRKNIIRKEAARKSVHIGAGIILVILPIFMDRWQIVLTNFGFLFGVIILTGFLHIFTVVHAVKRWTIGEYLYPLSTGLVAWVFTDLRIYSFSVFILALGDGLAGLLGREYGGKGYKIWHGSKSLLGNAVFFIIALFLILGLWTTTSDFTWSMLPIAILLSLWLTFVETLFAGGFDNITVTFSAALVAWYILLH